MDVGVRAESFLSLRYVTVMTGSVTTATIGTYGFPPFQHT
jgi:hypothetical protein